MFTSICSCNESKDGKREILLSDLLQSNCKKKSDGHVICNYYQNIVSVIPNFASRALLENSARSDVILYLAMF